MFCLTHLVRLERPLQLLGRNRRRREELGVLAQSGDQIFRQHGDVVFTRWEPCHDATLPFLGLGVV